MARTVRLGRGEVIIRAGIFNIITDDGDAEYQAKMLTMERASEKHVPGEKLSEAPPFVDSIDMISLEFTDNSAIERLIERLESLKKMEIEGDD